MIHKNDRCCPMCDKDVHTEIQEFQSTNAPDDSEEKLVCVECGYVFDEEDEEDEEDEDE